MVCKFVVQRLGIWSASGGVHDGLGCQKVAPPVAGEGCCSRRYMLGDTSQMTRVPEMGKRRKLLKACVRGANLNRTPPKIADPPVDRGSFSRNGLI
jgi:hypothetical protein